jgi:hypothetical protein
MPPRPSFSRRGEALGHGRGKRDRLDVGGRSLGGGGREHSADHDRDLRREIDEYVGAILKDPKEVRWVRQVVAPPDPEDEQAHERTTDPQATPEGGTSTVDEDDHGGNQREN